MIQHILDAFGWLLAPTVVNAWTAVSRVALSILCVRFIAVYANTLTVAERVGLGLMGGSSLLTILAVYDPTGPTSGWSHAILGTGALLFVAGISVRLTRHSERNKLAVEQKMIELRRKGIKP